jgi:integrase
MRRNIVVQLENRANHFEPARDSVPVGPTTSVAGSVGEGRPTFGEAASEWLRYIELDRKRRPSTVRDYRSVVRRHLLPEFGVDAPLARISLARIEQYRERMVSEGRAALTVNKILTNLHGIFRRAVRVWGLELNPVALVERQPVRRSGDFRVLSPPEIEKLICCAPTAQYRAIFAVAAYAGLRLGEVRALQWDDVDEERGVIRVRRSYAYGHLDSPKSGRVRSVPLIEQARSRLGAVAAARECREGLVFRARNGGFVDDSRIRRTFYESCGRAGIPRLRFHDLRHTFGTLAVQAFPLSDVSAYMGHADIQTTMIYVHHVPKRDAAERLGRLVRVSL